MRTIRRAAVVATFAASAFFVPVRAAPLPTGRWRRPLFPHPDAHSVASTSPIAAGPAETAAVWSVAEDVYTATFDGLGWSPPVLAMGLGQFPAWPADACIAADPDGGFWIAARGPTDYGSVFVTHGQGTTWSAPVEVGVVPDGNVWRFTIGAASGGRAMVVLAQESSSVAASRYFDGTSWGDIVPTGAHGVTLDGDFAMAADGTAFLAWWDADAGRPVVNTARWKDGAWSSPFGLAIGIAPKDDGDVPAPQIAMRPDGTARAVWTMPGDYELVDPFDPHYRPVYRVESRAFDGAVWSPFDTFVDAYDPRLALAGTRVLLTFARTTSVKPDFYVTRPTAVFFDGDAWSAPLALDAGRRGFGARCVLAADGTGFVTWNRCPADQYNVEYCDDPATQYGARFDGAAFGAAAPILPGVPMANNGRVATAARSSVALIGPTLVGADDASPETTYLGGFQRATSPVVTRIIARDGFAAGATATIVGAGFGRARGTLTLDGVALPVRSWTTSRVVARIPAGAGFHHLVVARADGGKAFRPIEYEHPTIAKPPRVTRTTGGKARILLRGRAFGSIDDDPAAFASVNGVEHRKGDPAIVRWTNSSITLLIPDSDATGDAYVVTSQGYDVRPVQ